MRAGGVIDEAALLAALETGQVAGAALDVFSSEPPGKTELVTHPNVIATPHIGAQTEEAQVRAAQDIAAEILAALQGDNLRWRVV
jgi:D-3-phosphoglycerate dehydrogenase / 2-oxoglutarate reductase